MSCSLAYGQGVPKTPQATRVTTIPEHQTMKICSRKWTHANNHHLAWLPLQPIQSEAGLRPCLLWYPVIQACMTYSECGTDVEEQKLESISILTNWHLKIFTADSILVATHPFSNLSEWLVWLTSGYFPFIIKKNTFVGKSLHRYLRKSIISILPGKYFSSTAT